MTIQETFNDFQSWQLATGNDYSQWLCGQTLNGVEKNNFEKDYVLNYSSENESLSIHFYKPGIKNIRIVNLSGQIVQEKIYKYESNVEMKLSVPGIYFVSINDRFTEKILIN